MKFKTDLLQPCLGIFLLFFSHSMAHSQITNEKYQTESIYLQNFKYIKNGTETRITAWNKDLKKEMEVSPDAVMEYDKFLKKRKTAFLLATAGLVSAITGLYVDNEALQYGLVLGGLGLAIVSVPISGKANKSLDKAIWLRNGAILY